MDSQYLFVIEVKLDYLDILVLQYNWDQASFNYAYLLDMIQSVTCFGNTVWRYDNIKDYPSQKSLMLQNMLDT